MPAVLGPQPGPARYPWQFTGDPNATLAASGGTLGPAIPPPLGIWVAFGTPALTQPNVRVRIDSPVGGVVDGFSIRRGRSYLTDKMDAGTASVSFVDLKGKLDPTNTTGPFYPMNPNCPCGITLYNPMTTTWTPIFTGLVQGVPQQVNMDSAVNRGTLEMADLFSMLALMEVPAGLDFTDNGNGTYSSFFNTNGNTKYPESTVQDRIKALLATAGVPSAMTNIFTGNVRVQQTVYAPGERILTAIQDAADAEFAGIANVFMGKDGVFNFRGRLARFNPSAYGIHTWNVGGTAQAAAHPNWAVLSGITLDRDVTKIINNALFAPQGIADANIAAQLVADAASIATYGPRGITGLNIISAGGTTGTIYAGQPLPETKLFSTFYVTNFKDAATCVRQATFRWLPPSHPNAAAHWNFLCNVELNDIISINTSHPGGGGFNSSTYFVEGITYDVAPGPVLPSTNEMIGDVTMTLDLSPQPFSTGSGSPITHWDGT